ncbi:MAG: HEAT repeat domain-containing protein [Gemmataceae bacterium]
MSMLRKMILAALVLACCPWDTTQAGVYVGFGGPGYYRPYRRGYGYGYGWGYGGYYRPYGFGMVVAPPIVVGGAPVVVQQPAIVQQPVVVQPTYSSPSPPPQAPAPLPMPSPSASVANAPGSPELMPTGAVGNAQAEIDAALQQLRGGDEQARADAAVSLGRLRSERAIGPIVKALNSDSSPIVREAAARGLGLIGSATALSALQYAAQADNDREVRHSASFAAETIRGNLRR